MRFSIYQDTLQGGRSSNQDRMGYVYSRETLLMMVADGMGGHLRGDVAAQLALQAAGTLFQQQARPRLRDPGQFLDQALRAGHRDLHKYREQHQLPECPRTTVVACVIQDGQVWWAHAGDSRLYLVRRGQVLTRTRDHSKVENMYSMGLITAEEMETHPERNKVLNCLGSPFEPSIELNTCTVLRDGDSLLLCSDGLWSGLTEDEIGSMLAEDSLGVVVPRMVRRAVTTNGATADNTTALALHWIGDNGEASGRTVSSNDLPEGAVTTTIGIEPETHVGTAPSNELSEDEIERTIAEIQEAIQRTGRTIP